MCASIHCLTFWLSERRCKKANRLETRDVPALDLTRYTDTSGREAYAQDQRLAQDTHKETP